MSRIGKRPIILHSTINAVIENGNIVTIEGPKGRLQHKISDQLKITKTDNKIHVETIVNNKKSRSLHGLSRTIINNMAIGVSEGFCKTLTIHGVGYRAQIKDHQNLILNIGYSHPVYMAAPAGIKLEINDNTEISVKGINKEIVGQFAAQIRLQRPPEPYKGKGIRYKNEFVRKKVGKAGK